MSDLIDRNKAIKMAEKVIDGNASAKAWTILARLKELPSAQPEPITIQIDHELTHDEFERLRKDMADAPIVLMPSTQEHKIHFADADHVWIDGKQYISLRRFQEAVVEAQQERKTGRWIPMKVSSGRDSWKCSVCGRRARGKLENLPYCHCGAKMEVEHDG